MAKVHPETFRKAALRASSSRSAARTVLMAMLLCLDFNNMTARCSRAALLDLTGLSEKAVKNALASLRKSGEMVPLAFATGGRGRCPIYTFPVAWDYLKRGEPATPLKRGEPETPQSDKGGNLTPETGEPSTPPSNTQDLRKGASRALGGIKGNMSDVWEGILNRLEIAENSKSFWIEPLTDQGRAGCVVTLEAPTAYHADYVRREYGAILLKAFKGLDADISRVEIKP